MKAVMLLTGEGALVILTSFSITDPIILTKLKAKGIDKFIAREIPLDLARERYGQHFKVASHDIRETEELHVIDYSGGRAFSLFKFSELGPATEYEEEG